MEAVLVLILVLLVFLLVLPIVAIVRSNRDRKRQRELDLRLTVVEQQLVRLRQFPASASAPAATPPTVAVPVASPTPTPPAAPSTPRPPAPIAAPFPASTAASTPTSPPVLAPTKLSPVTVTAAATPPTRPRLAIDWEQFMGAKLFAWLGGLALFLGIAFFVKYSFEHDLIPPEVRVSLGFLASVVLVVTGLKIRSPRYRIPAHTLCAAGIVSLYAVTFSCHAIYHFVFFGALPTFGLMALITAVAFLLAIRLDAKVVALLGLLGGFLTPVVISTGHDNPVGLFSYLALLDVGLLAVVLQRRWAFLAPLGAAGTLALEVAWFTKFFAPEKLLVLAIVGVGFSVLFQLAHVAARRLRRASPLLTATAAGFPLLQFGFVLFLVTGPAFAAAPALLFAFIFALDACLLALTWRDEAMAQLHLIAGAVVFLLLAIWTLNHIAVAPLRPALAAYVVFAAFHTAFPLLLVRRSPASRPTAWSQFFPAVTLLLMLVPLFQRDALSWLFWPCVLLVDALAVVFAFLSATILALGLVLVLTLAAAAAWIFQLPVAATSVPSLLLVGGVFVGFFFAFGLLLWRRAGERLQEIPTPSAWTAIFGDARAQIPAFSALLPFVLLMLMSQRLPLADPSPLFGGALLLAVLTLGVAWIFTLAWLPLCALIGIAGVEYLWHQRWAAAPGATTPLAWYALFYALFAVFPFLFRGRFRAATGPWATAALVGVAQFPLVYLLVKLAWPNAVMGLLPLVFTLAPLASLVVLVRARPAPPLAAPADSSTSPTSARLNQLAWFGGVALLFITLVFPIQFDRQWITIGWALEGLALFWLYRRVPHPGLHLVGAALLLAAFARLAFNPAVLHYHARASAPLLNWYLYAYADVIVCLVLSARLLTRSGQRILGASLAPLFHGLAVVLGFLLLNVEIADFFTAPGQRVLTFQFSGHFARDMTYTIAWALFAFGLLVGSLWRNIRAGRYAAIALLSAALVKLYAHDLARLGQLYRIGALLAVAVIAILASFAYHRFRPSHVDNPPPPPVA
ncbi:DUF2339 domain-containing protein [Horticoccus luteus]|uniref:DUF2339 domain-containing protein n=1 Tax=Horticoccus luteus TaxID=2862869 RepID=A0A8F9TVS3_9BACT|nr:DUF2339 domain-containing protein [Horticoccus luteus]QYM79198.1 DUF2339 domain-containing protein [Horticoccus luteus]